jgi:Sulfotransferase family
VKQLLQKNFPQASGSGRGHLPTFIGIGSMRCGSTWLYQVLKCHPDIQLAECKELDFFFMRKMLRYDLRWYEEQFEPANGAGPKPLRGEISPLYARLKQWQVNRIASLLPAARIVLTLRHPIERVWSQALYEFGHRSHRDVRKVGPTEFLRQVERPRSQLSSDYYRTIKIWSNAFGRDALHVGFFDQLREDPDTYLNSVLKHIGASIPWTLPEEFRKKKVWATNSLVAHDREIPEIIRWYIADRLLEPTERLNELLEGRASAWVEELRNIRGQTRLSWRISRELNRFLLSLPERLAYEGFHALLDVRLWLRWRQFQKLSGRPENVAKQDLQLHGSY